MKNAPKDIWTLSFLNMSGAVILWTRPFALTISKSFADSNHQRRDFGPGSPSRQGEQRNDATVLDPLRFGFDG